MLIIDPTKDLLSFLRSLPKTEIHLHLEGCLSADDYQSLCRKNKIEPSPHIYAPHTENFDLDRFIRLFFSIQDAIRKPEDLQFLVHSLAEYLALNNVIYAEVFFAPNRLVDKGLPFQDMLDVLVAGIRELEQKQHRTVRLLIDVSRSFGPERAMNTLENVLAYRQPEVIGIGLGGLEQIGPAPEYRQVFALARAEGLKTVAHAGEDAGPQSIWDALDVLQVDRIGHAVCAFQDPTLMEHLKTKKILLEVCITSNLHTQSYINSVSEHPVRTFYKQGIPICINSDDPAIFHSDISQEYLLLLEQLGFSLPEIQDLFLQGVEATFHPDKKTLRNTIQKSWDELPQKYPMLFSG